MGDQHAWSETYQRDWYTYLIVDQHAWSETSMLIGDGHASPETDMPHQRPTCLIGDEHVWSQANMTHCRPTCLIGDQHASLETYGKPTCLIEYTLNTSIRHVIYRYMGLRSGMSFTDIWVSDQACWSTMDLRSDMLVYK